MSPDKIVLYIAITVGGFVGGYIPSFFGVDALSGWSIFWSTVGSVVAIWLWFKFIRNQF